MNICHKTWESCSRSCDNRGNSSRDVQRFAGSRFLISLLISIQPGQNKGTINPPASYRCIPLISPGISIEFNGHREEYFLPQWHVHTKLPLTGSNLKIEDRRSTIKFECNDSISLRSNCWCDLRSAISGPYMALMYASNRPRCDIEGLDPRS